MTTYSYDAQGRLTRSDPPGIAKRSYSYDLVGNPEEATPGVLNRAPTANADSFTVTAFTGAQVRNPKANDTDPEGDSLSITWVGNVTSRANDGSGRTVATISRSGSDGVRIVGHWPGVAWFDYVISDGRHGEAGVRSSVRVQPNNDPGAPQCGNLECDRTTASSGGLGGDESGDDATLPGSDEGDRGEGE